MSELVVDLTNPESVALARQILEVVGNDWPNPARSAETTPPWEGPDEIDRSRGSESNSKADDADPWATSAPSPDKPRAAEAAPSETPTASTANDDDDDPWS